MLSLYTTTTICETHLMGDASHCLACLAVWNFPFISSCSNLLLFEGFTAILFCLFHCCLSVCCRYSSTSHHVLMHKLPLPRKREGKYVAVVSIVTFNLDNCLSILVYLCMFVWRFFATQTAVTPGIAYLQIAYDHNASIQQIGFVTLGPLHCVEAVA